MSRSKVTATPQGMEVRQARGRLSGKWVIAVAAGVLLLVAAPLVIHGTPLADDYIICMRPANDGGYASYLQDIWRDTGVVRPARFVELFLISKTCRSMPFGLLILVPLALKFAAAFLLYGLLRDLRLPSPWPEMGTAMWLLEPLGTEAALWPSALHVLLGLVLALAALRLYRSGRMGWAALATLGACLSVEQVIFAIPLAVWMTAPKEERRRATMVAVAVVVPILIAYTIWPGTNPRQALTLAQRLHNALAKGGWYVLFPAVGLGLYSGALGFLWAFPYSVAAVIAGPAIGAVAMPRLLSGRSTLLVDRRIAVRWVLGLGALILLVNLPLIVTEVGYSARTFTPTWLVLSGALAVAGAHVRWSRPQVLGIFSGMFAAFAVLSLVLSVSVRIRTAQFDRAAARWIADRVDNGAVVAVCDVGRTVVHPAPLGAFHLHEFQEVSGAWIQYYTGRVVTIRRSGLRYWGSRCPNLRGADVVVSFPALVRQLTASQPGT